LIINTASAARILSLLICYSHAIRENFELVWCSEYEKLSSKPSINTHRFLNIYWKQSRFPPQAGWLTESQSD
jgi:hypothetical protein